MKWTIGQHDKFDKVIPIHDANGQLVCEVYADDIDFELATKRAQRIAALGDAPERVAPVTVKDLYDKYVSKADTRPIMVVFCAYGNPDHKQYAPVAEPMLTFYARGAFEAGDALEDVRQYIDEHGLGGGNWGRDSGKVYDNDVGAVTELISYNGRFMPLREHPSDYAAAQLLGDLAESGLDRLPEPRQ